jgi:3-hydroxyacyl-[acyl-carrier-protein] dehydratase
MSWAISEDLLRVLRRAEKEPLLPEAQRGGATLLGREALEALLPHRGLSLLLDRVVALDLQAGRVAARYDLSHGREVLKGHFPGRPVWPGVLQLESIGQAGLVLRRYQQPAAAGEAYPALTHVLGARFLRPVRPDGDLEVLAMVMEDGLFQTTVGQCVSGGQICSVAAVSGL